MIFNKSFLKKKRVKLDDPKSEEGEYWWTNIVVEARAVSLWSCVVMAVRILLGLLRELAVHRDSTSSDHQRSALDQELIMTASVVAGWIFSWMPSKIMTQQAPGFVFANPL
jgi:dolichyl-phosphate-mannose--protein O-mannosyl transferase